MVEPGFKCKHFDIRVSAPVASGCLCGAWPGKGCVDASVIIWLDLSLAVQFSTTHLLPSLSGCFWGMLAASLPLLSVLGTPKWFLFTPFTALLTCPALQSLVAPGTAYTLAGGLPY